MPLWTKLQIFAALWICAPTFGWAASATLANVDATRTIRGLSWDTRTPEIQDSRVLLRGKFKKPQWTLVWGNESKPVKVKTDQSFEIEVDLKEPVRSIELIAIGPLGELEKEPMTLSASDVAPPEKKWSATPVLGLAWLSYSESGAEPYSSLMTTIRAQGAYQLKPGKWEVAAEATLSLFSLYQNQDASVWDYGLNWRVGYHLPQLKAPWKLTLSGGSFYTSTVDSEDRFGISNVGGPQLSAILSRDLGQDRSATGYLKFSPIFNGFGLQGLSSKALAAGGEYSFKVRQRHRLGVHLDFSRWAVSTTARQGAATSIGMGASYHF